MCALSLSLSQGNSQTNNEGYSTAALDKSTHSPGALPSLVNVYPSGLAIRCCLVAALKVRGWLISACHRARTPMTAGLFWIRGGTRNQEHVPHPTHPHPSSQRLCRVECNAFLLSHATLCSLHPHITLCNMLQPYKKPNTTHSSHTKHKIQSFYPWPNSTRIRKSTVPRDKSRGIAISHILIHQEHKKTHTCTRLAGCI